MTPSPRPPPSTDHAERIQNKEEILAAIERLSESGIKISVEQVRGREDLLAALIDLTAEFRAATDHLRRLNGSIERHEADLETLNLRAAAWQKTGPPPRVSNLRPAQANGSSCVLPTTC